MLQSSELKQSFQVNRSTREQNLERAARPLDVDVTVESATANFRLMGPHRSLFDLTSYLAVSVKSVCLYTLQYGSTGYQR